MNLSNESQPLQRVFFSFPHSPTSSRAIKPSNASKPGNGSTELIVVVATAKSRQPDQPNLTSYQQVANAITRVNRSFNVEQTRAFATTDAGATVPCLSRYTNEKERGRERRRERERNIVHYLLHVNASKQIATTEGVIKHRIIVIPL